MGGGLLGFGTFLAPLLSSEPGYYRDGEFGIRIEDVALVVEAQTKVTPAPLPPLPTPTSIPRALHQAGGAQGRVGGLGTALGWWGPLLCSHLVVLGGVCTRQGAGGTHLTASPRQHPTGEEPFLTFEVVSLVPYDRNLIDVSLLSQEQVRGRWERMNKQSPGGQTGPRQGRTHGRRGAEGPGDRDGLGPPGQPPAAASGCR